MSIALYRCAHCGVEKKGRGAVVRPDQRQLPPAGWLKLDEPPGPLRPARWCCSQPCFRAAFQKQERERS